jgi:hypothetical protein
VAGWISTSASRQPGPEPAQKQPKQPVNWAKALIRTSEDAELVPQGKGLEQEIPTRCLSRSGRRPCRHNGSHRLVDCRLATSTSMEFAWRNIGEGQAVPFDVRFQTIGYARWLPRSKMGSSHLAESDVEWR